MAVKNTTSDKPTSSDVARYRANYLSEQEGVYLYSKLAEIESDTHLFPFIFTSGFTAVVISLILSLFGLFGIGAGVSLTSGSPLWKSGGRQVLLGLLAAGITFGLGKLIGSAIS
jgi:hypothetical protein